MPAGGAAGNIPVSGWLVGWSVGDAGFQGVTSGFLRVITSMTMAGVAMSMVLFFEEVMIFCGKDMIS